MQITFQYSEQVLLDLEEEVQGRVGAVDLSGGCQSIAFILIRPENDSFVRNELWPAVELDAEPPHSGMEEAEEEEK